MEERGRTDGGSAAQVILHASSPKRCPSGARRFLAAAPQRLAAFEHRQQNHAGAQRHGQVVELHGLFSMGASIAVAESVEKLTDNFREVQPTLLFSVPRC